MDSLAPLRDGRFRWLLVGRTVPMFGSSPVDIALAFAVPGTSNSPGALGAVLAAHVIPMDASMVFSALGPVKAKATVGVGTWGLVLSADTVGYFSTTVVLLRIRLRHPLRMGMIGVVLLGLPMPRPRAGCHLPAPDRGVVRRRCR